MIFLYFWLEFLIKGKIWFMSVCEGINLLLVVVFEVGSLIKNFWVGIWEVYWF